jgi:hypothetical protein
MADEKKNAKKKYQRSERRYRRISKSTSESLKPDELYPQTHLDQLKQEIEAAHKEVEEEAELYRELLDSDEDTDKPEVIATDTLLDELQLDLSKVETIIAKLTVILKAETEPQKVEKRNSEASATKLQRFVPPKFNGDVRAFPAFKSSLYNSASSSTSLCAASISCFSWSR